MSNELQKYDPVAAAKKIDEALAGLRNAVAKNPPPRPSANALDKSNLFDDGPAPIYDWQAEADKSFKFEMDEVETDILTKDKNGTIRAERTIRRRVRKG